MSDDSNTLIDGLVMAVMLIAFALLFLELRLAFSPLLEHLGRRPAIDRLVVLAQ